MIISPVEIFVFGCFVLLGSILWINRWADNYVTPENTPTRIKVVTQGDDIKYYPEYWAGIFWLWNSIKEGISDEDYVFTLEDAQKRIDNFIVRRAKRRQEDLIRVKKKKIKPKTTYIKYP